MRSYARLRRRYRRFSLAGPAIFLLLAISLSASRDALDSVVGHALILLFFVALLAYLLVGMIAQSALLRFRCPRCGEWFNRTWWNNKPTDRCKHCRLDLGPAAMDWARANWNMDLPDIPYLGDRQKPFWITRPPSGPSRVGLLGLLPGWRRDTRGASPKDAILRELGPSEGLLW